MRDRYQFKILLQANRLGRLNLKHVTSYLSTQVKS